MSKLVPNKIKGHDPLPANVYMNKSPIHGMGIFAKEDIPAGFDFGITHVADKRFPDGLIRTPLGAYINYSPNPNVIVYEDGDTLRMKTLTNITAGEELTLDYRPWYDDKVLATYN